MTNEAMLHLVADPDRARRAADTLFAALEHDLGPQLPASAEMLHVGATAIPGCLTKGDLDVAIRVDADDFPAAAAILAARFAPNAGSIRTADFAAFEGRVMAPALGLQLTVRDGQFDVFHRFAVALRADPSLVARYNALKIRCDGAPMSAYRQIKAAFIREILSTRP